LEIDCHLKWNIHVSSLILSFGKKLNLLKTITLKRIIANITAFLLRRQHLTTLYQTFPRDSPPPPPPVSSKFRNSAAGQKTKSGKKAIRQPAEEATYPRISFGNEAEEVT
jgi:hypothetical protein